MITKRLAVLFIIVLCGVLCIFLLPKSYDQPTGLVLKDGAPWLPANVGGWQGKDGEITKREIDTLGPGTQFARKIYKHPAHPNYQALVTIVLSGRDISNSLHRPERCLDAQGWAVLDGKELAIPIGASDTFPVKRLHNSKTRKLPDGTIAPLEAFSYYWFIGEHAITADHVGRFVRDNADRLFRGVDQRWAFVTVTAGIPATTLEQMAPARAWVDRELKDFLMELAPAIHGKTVNY